MRSLRAMTTRAMPARPFSCIASRMTAKASWASATSGTIEACLEETAHGLMAEIMKAQVGQACALNEVLPCQPNGRRLNGKDQFTVAWQIVKDLDGSRR